MDYNFTLDRSSHKMNLRIYTDGGDTLHSFDLEPLEIYTFVWEFQKKAYRKKWYGILGDVVYCPRGTITVGGKTFNVADLELGYVIE